MFSYLVRRLLYAVPILLGVILLTFLLFRVVNKPEYAALHALGPKSSEKARADWIHEHGRDRPMVVQFAMHVKRMVTFDFEPSDYTKRPMGETFRAGVGPSLCVTLPGFIAGLIAALALSLYQVFARNSLADRNLTILCVIMMSVPTVLYIIFGQAVVALGLGWFPVSGCQWGGFGMIRFLVLPVSIMVIINLGYDGRMFRAVFLEEIAQDYVRTAHAKGLPVTAVLGRHVLKNGLIALITLTVGQLPKLIMGTLLIESFFGIPGIGNVMVQAIQTADEPVVLATAYLGALLYLAALTLTDILYAAADPRIRLS
jgi:peptide/nickel transport system permease protein